MWFISVAHTMQKICVNRICLICNSVFRGTFKFYVYCHCCFISSLDMESQKFRLWIYSFSILLRVYLIWISSIKGVVVIFLISIHHSILPTLRNIIADYVL